MARVDEDEWSRQDRAEQLRERDRQREPRSFRRLTRDLARRDALQITLVERAAATHDEGAVDDVNDEQGATGRDSDV